MSRRHLTSRNGSAEAGFSLLELLIAGMVMTVGLMGGMALILTAMANDNRSKMDSSATMLSQMVMEMIASVPANATVSSTPGSSVTVVDCNPDSSLASHTINTLGTTSGAGAALTGAGGIDFTQATVTGYAMSYYACQASTGDRQATYDVRWNVKTINSNAKLVVVSAKRTATNSQGNFFAVPVSLKMIVGL